jgi:hypothetical protein
MVGAAMKIEKLIHEKHERHEINILRAFALQQNACLPHFVIFVSFVDKPRFLG